MEIGNADSLSQITAREREFIVGCRNEACVICWRFCGFSSWYLMSFPYNCVTYRNLDGNFQTVLLSLSLCLYLPSSRLILFCSSDCLIIDSSRVRPFPSFALLALSRASTCSSYLTEKQNCNGWNKQSLASNWNELTLICILILEFVTQIKFISVRLKPFMPPLHINRKIKKEKKM